MYRIMIVDDKEVFRRKIKRLEYFKDNQNFVIVDEAENGEEALEKIQSEQIDVLITDIRMPKIDGIELLKLVRQSNLCPCVILLSEYSDFSYAKEGLVYGAFDYIVKPIDNEKIEQIMNRVLRFFVENHRELVLIGAENLLFPAVLENSPELESVIQRILQELDDNEYMQIKDKIAFIQNLLEQLEVEIFHKMTEILLYVQVKEMIVLSFVNDEKYEELKNYFSYIVPVITRGIHQFDVDTENATINKICNHILKQVERDVSLTSVADEFYLNSKYLSTLFGQETGISYVRYVTRVKMARAAYLLDTSDCKVYEIAERLGYDDVEYFSHVFKMIYLQTPNNYKKEISEWKKKRELVTNY